MTTAKLPLSLLAVGLTAVACSLPGAPAPASGDDYPTKTVTVVVPYSAGGPTDLAGRVITECLSDELEANFIVENKDGGAGAIGTLDMIRSKPDGYTLGVGTVGSVVVAPQLSNDAGYTYEQVLPLSKIYQLDSAILVKGDSTFKSAEQFFEAARKKPDSVSVAVGGASTEYALELRRMAQEYDVQLSVVPFDGGAPAHNALLGGNVDALFAAVNQPVLEMIEDGRVRALATGGEERSEVVPDAPTLSELGFESLTNTETFFSMLGPEGLDEAVQQTLTDSVHACLETEDVKKRLGADFIPADPGGPESIREEYAEKSAAVEKVLG